MIRHEDTHNEHVGTVDRWFDERVEAYLDGELPEREERMFEAQLAIDPALAKALDRAMEVSASLAAMPRYRCPTDLASRVDRITDLRPRAGAPRRRWASLAVAACACALVGGLWLGAPDAPTGPTDAELAAARADLALALSYLDKAGNTATREIGQQVVSEGLIGPVEKSMRSARENAS